LEVDLASWIQGDFLRVLLVSTEEELRYEIDDALAGRAGDHRLYWVSQPDLAAGRAHDLSPHIILLDADALGSLTGDLVAQLVGSVPDAGVVLLVQPEGMDLARQAVLAGARGFVTKPVKPDDLIGAMRQVLSRRGPTVEPVAEGLIGRVVVFCAPKGGTGRTTLAINTSIGMQQVTRQPVVLVDADYAAPAIDVALNLHGDRDISELRSKISQLDRDLVSSVLVRHESGLSVLLAPPPADMTMPFSLPQVQQVLVWLKRMFPWVVVDLGLPLDDTSFAFLDSADLIVISVLPEMIGLRNTRLMFDQLLERGYPEDKIWLILNRQGLPGGVARPVIEEWLGRKIQFGIPNDQALATETINRGIPFVLGHRRSAVAKACLGLAGDLVRALPETGVAGDVASEGAAIAAGATASAAGTSRRRLLRPVLAGAIAVLIMLVLATRVFPSILRGQSEPSGAPAVSPTISVVAVAAETSATAQNVAAATLAEESRPVEATESPSAIAIAGQASPSAEPEVAATEVLPTPTGIDSPVPTETPSRTPTPSPAPTATETPIPTATPTPEPTATPAPSPTAARRPPTRVPTRTGPAPTSTVMALAASDLAGPGEGENASGTVTFSWRPTGALPAGAAYEVVIWYPNEDPSAARGVAPPTTDSALKVDLNGLYNFGQLKSGDFFWTVLVVRTNPYVRLTAPTAANARKLNYQPPGGGGPSAAPTKPI
jgi:pilus assembly protein CpaE